jgi:DNA-binding GntR family transcriptional regulator
MVKDGGFQTKTEWIYSQLRDMITSGELAAGSRLPLAPLAERFGTSEIPVREAMRMLHRDGLVTIESHRGATVATVSWTQLYEAIFIRSYLEILAAEESVTRHDDTTLEPVLKSLLEMDELATQPHSGEVASAFSVANRAFHLQLYEPCPYPLLVTEITDLWDRLWRTRSQSLFYMAREQMLRVQEEHREMYEAARTGDVDRATAAAEKHREGNLQAWARIIEETTGVHPGHEHEPAGAAAEGSTGSG